MPILHFATTFTRKFEMNTLQGIQSFSEGSTQKRRHATNSTNPLGWPVSAICTATIYGRYVLYGRFAELEEKLCWPKFLSAMLLRHRMQKDNGKYEMERPIAVTSKELETRPKTSMRSPPTLETCINPVPFLSFHSPFSHLFLLISICRHYSRNERNGKSGNNGESPRIDRNRSSMPSKGFSRENLAEIKEGSSAKIVVIE